jgi:hypothetical protein
VKQRGPAPAALLVVQGRKLQGIAELRACMARIVPVSKGRAVWCNPRTKALQTHLLCASTRRARGLIGSPRPCCGATRQPVPLPEYPAGHGSHRRARRPIGIPSRRTCRPEAVGHGHGDATWCDQGGKPMHWRPRVGPPRRKVQTLPAPSPGLTPVRLSGASGRVPGQPGSSLSTCSCENVSDLGQ